MCGSYSLITALPLILLLYSLFTREYIPMGNTNIIVKFADNTTVIGLLLINFYRCTIESVIKYCITAGFSSYTSDNKKALQRIIRSGQWIIGTHLPTLEEIHYTRYAHRIKNIVKDNTLPGHRFFTLLPSGKRYRTLLTRTTQLKNVLNSTPGLTAPTTFTLLAHTPAHIPHCNPSGILRCAIN